MIAVVIGECDLDRAAVDDMAVGRRGHAGAAMSFGSAPDYERQLVKAHPSAASEAGLVLAGNRLDSAECFLNALADMLADGMWRRT